MMKRLLSFVLTIILVCTSFATGTPIFAINPGDSTQRIITNPIIPYNPSDPSAPFTKLKMTSAGRQNQTYESPNFGPTDLYELQFLAQDSSYAGLGFCMNHGAGASRNQMFINTTDVGMNSATKLPYIEEVRPYLAFYYYISHIMTNPSEYAKIPGEPTEAEKSFEQYPAEKRKAFGFLLQSVIWLNEQFNAGGPGHDLNSEGKKHQYAVEMKALIDAYNQTAAVKVTDGGEPYTLDKCKHSIDYIQSLITENKVRYDLEKFNYYVFQNKGDNTEPSKILDSTIKRNLQRMLIANYVDRTTQEPVPVYIKFQKTNPEGAPLEGSAFSLQGPRINYPNIEPQGANYTIGGGPEQPYSIRLSHATQFILTEIKAPEGYQKLKQPIKITLDPNVHNTPETALLVQGGNVVNNKTQEIPKVEEGKGLIVKVDKDTGESLPGAVFRLTAAGKGVNMEVTTTANGAELQAKTPGTADYIAPGSYSVEEIVAPTGYELDTRSPKAQTLSVSDDGVITPARLVFQNTKKKTIELYKQDPAGNPLAGAVFSVYKDGTFLFDKTSGEDGKIIIEDLAKGAYTFYEKQAPAGYELPTPTIANSPIVFVDPEDGHDTYYVNHINNKLKTIRLKKVSRDGEALDGAMFEIMYNGKLLTRQATEGGEIVLEDAKSGTYTFTEITPPNGYLLPHSRDLVKTLYIEPDSQQEEFIVTYENYKAPSIQIRKISQDGETEKALPGAEFEVKIDNRTFGTFTTNEEGIIEINDDKFGEWLANNHLENHNSWDITATELTPPEGYLPAVPRSQTNTVTKGQTLSEFVFINSVYPEIVIEKLDSATGKPLAGTTFEVMIDATHMPGSFATDENGIVRINYKDYKAYLGTKLNQDNTSWTVTVTETSPAANYFLAGNLTPRVQTGELKMGVSLAKFTYKNQPTPDLKVFKKSTKRDEPVMGVTYSIVGVDNPLKKTATTDAFGWATFENLPEGTYTLKEKSVPTGYVLSDKTYTIVSKPTNNGSGEKQIMEIEYGNDDHPELTIIKTDSVTKKPLKDVKFDIHYQPDDNNGVYVDLGTYSTDANGKIVFTKKDQLPTGFYTITEVNPPEGYTYHKDDGKSKTIHLQGNESYTHTVRNVPQTSVQIIKIDKETKKPLKGAEFEIRNVDGTLVGNYTTDANGVLIVKDVPAGNYIAKETKAPAGYVMDKAEKRFKVTSNEFVKLVFENPPAPTLQIIKKDKRTKEPVAGAHFEVIKLNGQKVASGETDSNGLLNITDVELHCGYLIKETEAPEGYLKDDTEHKVTLKQSGTTTVTIYNEKASGFMLYKIDATTKNPLQGAEFLLSDSRRNTIGTYTTDNKGRIYVDGIKPGTYTLKEIKAPEGYELDTKDKTFQVSSGNITTITWENRTKLAQIQIKKLAKDASSITGLPEDAPLKGAVYNIYHTATNKLASQIITGNDGIGVSKLLPLGTYTIREIKAPKFYAKSSKEWTVVLGHEMQIEKLTVYNPPLKPGVSITKTGVREAACGSQILYTISNVANMSNTSMDNFFVKDSLPHQAVKADYITTGTYSNAQLYDVYIRTNTGRKVQIAGNLNTTVNNYVPINPKLMAGEEVMDVMLIFGHVPQGFRMMQDMKVGVTVKSGTRIPAFVNKAYAGGTIDDEWLVKTSEFRTGVWCKVPNNPPRLPKTGY